MNKILIDTMCIEAIFTHEEPLYTTFADKIDEGKIIGVSSVVTLTEMIKNLGRINEEKMEKTVRRLKSSEIVIIDVTQEIAERAGKLRIKYEIPTIYSLIAATCLSENIKHILTKDKRHFGKINKLKIIDIETAIRL